MASPRQHSVAFANNTRSHTNLSTRHASSSVTIAGPVASCPVAHQNVITHEARTAMRTSYGSKHNVTIANATQCQSNGKHSYKPGPRRSRSCSLCGIGVHKLYPSMQQPVVLLHRLEDGLHQKEVKNLQTHGTIRLLPNAHENQETRITYTVDVISRMTFGKPNANNTNENSRKLPILSKLREYKENDVIKKICTTDKEKLSRNGTVAELEKKTKSEKRHIENTIMSLQKDYCSTNLSEHSPPSSPYSYSERQTQSLVNSQHIEYNDMPSSPYSPETVLSLPASPVSLSWHVNSPPSPSTSDESTDWSLCLSPDTSTTTLLTLSDKGCPKKLEQNNTNKDTCVAQFDKTTHTMFQKQKCDGNSLEISPKNCEAIQSVTENVYDIHKNSNNSHVQNYTDDSINCDTNLKNSLFDLVSKKEKSSLKLKIKQNPNSDAVPLKKWSNKENGIPKIVLKVKGEGSNKEYSCSNKLRSEDENNTKKHKSKKERKSKTKTQDKRKRIHKAAKHKRHLQLFGEDSNDDSHEYGVNNREKKNYKINLGYSTPHSLPTIGESPNSSDTEIKGSAKIPYSYSVLVEKVCETIKLSPKHNTSRDSDVSDSLPDLEQPTSPSDRCKDSQLSLKIEKSKPSNKTIECETSNVSGTYSHEQKSSENTNIKIDKDSIDKQSLLSNSDPNNPTEEFQTIIHSHHSKIQRNEEIHATHKAKYFKSKMVNFEISHIEDIKDCSSVAEEKKAVKESNKMDTLNNSANTIDNHIENIVSQFNIEQQNKKSNKQMDKHQSTEENGVSQKINYQDFTDSVVVTPLTLNRSSISEVSNAGKEKNIHIENGNKETNKEITKVLLPTENLNSGNEKDSEVEVNTEINVKPDNGMSKTNIFTDRKKSIPVSPSYNLPSKENEIQEKKYNGNNENFEENGENDLQINSFEPISLVTENITNTQNNIYDADVTSYKLTEDLRSKDFKSFDHLRGQTNNKDNTSCTEDQNKDVDNEDSLTINCNDDENNDLIIDDESDHNIDTPNKTRRPKSSKENKSKLSLKHPKKRKFEKNNKGTILLKDIKSKKDGQYKRNKKVKLNSLDEEEPKVSSEENPPNAQKSPSNEKSKKKNSEAKEAKLKKKMEKIKIAARRNQLIQEEAKRRENEHEEERGKRLAQEIKGFNWLEQKIKSGGLGERQASLPGPAHLPARRAIIPPPARYVVRRHSAGDVVGRRGHLQTAVPPLLHSSRPTVLPKSRASFASMQHHVPQNHAIASSTYAHPQQHYDLSQVSSNHVQPKGSYPISHVFAAQDYVKPPEQQLYGRYYPPPNIDNREGNDIIYREANTSRTNQYTNNPSSSMNYAYYENVSSAARHIPLDNPHTASNSPPSDPKPVHEERKACSTEPEVQSVNYSPSSSHSEEAVQKRPSSNTSQSSISSTSGIFSHKHLLLKRAFSDMLRTEPDTPDSPQTEPPAKLPKPSPTVDTKNNGDDVAKGKEDTMEPQKENVKKHTSEIIINVSDDENNDTLEIDENKEKSQKNIENESSLELKSISIDKNSDNKNMADVQNLPESIRKKMLGDGKFEIGQLQFGEGQGMPSNLLTALVEELMKTRQEVEKLRRVQESMLGGKDEKKGNGEDEGKKEETVDTNKPTDDSVLADEKVQKISVRNDLISPALSTDKSKSTEAIENELNTQGSSPKPNTGHTESKTIKSPECSKPVLPKSNMVTENRSEVLPNNTLKNLISPTHIHSSTSPNANNNMNPVILKSPTLRSSPSPSNPSVSRSSPSTFESLLLSTSGSLTTSSSLTSTVSSTKTTSIISGQIDVVTVDDRSNYHKSTPSYRENQPYDCRRQMHEIQTLQQFIDKERTSIHSSPDVQEFPMSLKTPPLRPSPTVSRRQSRGTPDSGTPPHILHKSMQAAVSPHLNPALVSSTSYHPQATPINYTLPANRNEADALKDKPQYPTRYPTGRSPHSKLLPQVSIFPVDTPSTSSPLPSTSSPLTSTSSPFPTTNSDHTIKPRSPKPQRQDDPYPKPPNHGVHKIPYQPPYHKVMTNIEKIIDAELPHVANRKPTPGRNFVTFNNIRSRAPEGFQPQTFTPRVIVQNSSPTHPILPHHANKLFGHGLPYPSQAPHSHPVQYPNAAQPAPKPSHRAPPYQFHPPTIVGDNRDMAVPAPHVSGEKKMCLNQCFMPARFLCSGCKKAWYCSEHCQRHHWRIHGLNCAP